MTTDTQLAPTDAEIDALWRFEASKNWDSTLAMRTSYTRAVLAKWGTPAPVGVEPVAIYHGRCTIDCGEHGHLDMELLKMIPAGSKLYTTPQPTQPQAGAVPLIRQLVAALEGYRRNHNDTQPCDAEREGRAWLEKP